MQPNVSSDSKPHILVIDRDSGTSRFVSLLFNEAYAVVPSYSASLALTMLKEKPYAMIVASIELQVKGYYGARLLHKIRSLAGYERVPIIGVTSLELPGERNALMAEGLNAYIVKPFMKEDFRGTVLQILDQAIRPAA